MAESWVDGFNAALLRFLQKYRPEAVKITNYDDYPAYGGCDTCGPEYEVDFSYLCGDEDCPRKCTFYGDHTVFVRGHSYSFNGTLGGVIEELTRE